MKQKLFKILALLIIAGSLIGGWLLMNFDSFMDNPTDLPEMGMDINVTKGATFASISRELYAKGIILSEFYPRLAGKLYPELTKLKHGEYHLSHGMTPREIFSKLVSGNVKIYQIRFIEGWTLNNFLTELGNESRLRQDLRKSDKQYISAQFQISQSNPEGWFYPDTYFYQQGASDLQILKISHRKMKQKLQQYWLERDIDLPYENPYQVLIMASIIEKETGHAGERNRIAGVFVRRLNMGMRLQTDPTVIYGMAEKFNGNITKSDLLTDTPYNTYRHKGLPPTPIAMPSEASLSAAVHPEDGTELYFVAKGDGSHQFSSTLQQHQEAVKQFQLRKNKE